MPTFKEVNNKMSGTGNGSLQITTTERTYYGREPKYGTLRVTGDQGLRYSTVSLKLKGAAEFIDATSSKDATGNIVISGRANVKDMYFASSTAQIVGAKINGVSVTNLWNGSTLAAIPNDPGATDAFSFEIYVTVDESSATTNHTVVLSGGSASKTVTFTTSGGDITFESINLGAISGGNTFRYTAGEDVLPVTTTPSNLDWMVATLPSWLYATPATGTGNGRITLNRSQNNGRSSRSYDIVVHKPGNTDVNGNTRVTQNGRGLFLEIQNKTIVKDITDVGLDGSMTVVITGTTNADTFPSNFMQFSGLDGMSAELVQFSVLGNTYLPSDFPITLNSDPGIDDAFNFSASVKLTPELGATSAVGRADVRVSATGFGTISDSADFSLQPSGEDYLEVRGDENGIINISVAGEEVLLSVASSVNWEIEEL